ncbi:MAG: NADH:ubiquinone oxidoreductase subunit J [Legionellales bacterium RIFCSPHIGHO2_12_FULL_35_11]|nr:MAG: NADH:ubiquinone oxidoreductase subunit J [Legionellales bacterium RIFCSPHIGHO2_12_FULL_35_11]
MHNVLQQVIFYIFAGLTIFSALMVITQNNPVRCVLFLVLAFISSSVLWILVYAEFLALILVLVYVGAVMTLFLFVVMMLNIDIESAKKDIIKKLPIGLVFVAILVSLLFGALPKNLLTSSVETTKNNSSNIVILDDKASTRKISNTEALGMVLYTDYFLAFELAAVILLTAIIAAITLAHRAPIRSKRQNVTKQIMTERNERIKLVQMPAEK